MPPPTDPESSAIEDESSDAFDRGRDETLRLDPDTDQRLRAVAIATLDVEPDAVAVAADRAVGVLEGTTMRIVADGEQIATRDFRTPNADGRRVGDSIAFDTDGTLWVWTGDGVAGLRRDGTSVDLDDVVPPASSPGGGAELRVDGTDVSVVLYDLDRPSWAEVVPVVGNDPLEGVRTVDAPVSDDGTILHPGEPYIDSLRAMVTSEVLVSGSIVGANRADLDWTELPSTEAGFSGTSSDSPIVADTAASLLSISAYDGAFLTVHRGDGVSAVALVAPGAGDQVSVSPDGAVHVATIGGGTATVRTLLDADLQPLEAPSVEVVADAPASRATPDVPECGEPGAADQIVDDVDLDADGQLDRVTLHQDGLVLACLADGSSSTMSAWPASELPDATQTLARVDLGGVDGVMVTLVPGPEVDFHVQNYLLRLRDGALSAVGDPVGETGGPVYAGEDIRSGNVGAKGFGVIGCRPATVPDADFEAIMLTHFAETDRLRADVTVFVGDGMYSLQFLAPDLFPDLPRTAPRDELDAVLRDAGFSPGCRPIGPDDEPVTPAPTAAPVSASAACDDEREWDIEVDLDADGELDRITLTPRGVDSWGLLVACMADGSVASIAVGPGPPSFRDGFVVLEHLDLGGTPAVAIVQWLGAEFDDGQYEVFVLAGPELVALTPNETSGRLVDGVLRDLAIFGNTRVETFGCRPRADGGVDVVELLIERVDADVTTDPGAPAYTGERLAVSYVVRPVEPDWSGFGRPSERVELPEYDGGTARPAEILDDLGATWLCAP